MTASAAKASKSVLAKTVKSPKAAAKSRKVADRKEITRTLRSIERIQAAFAKATATLAKEGEDLKGPIHDQMAQVLAQLGIAVTVTQSEIETQAQALARTFLGK